MDQRTEAEWGPVVGCQPVTLRCTDCTAQPVVLTDGTGKRLAWHRFNDVFGAPFCPASGAVIS